MTTSPNRARRLALTTAAAALAVTAAAPVASAQGSAEAALNGSIENPVVKPALVGSLNAGLHGSEAVFRPGPGSPVPPEIGQFAAGSLFLALMPAMSVSCWLDHPSCPG